MTVCHCGPFAIQIVRATDARLIYQLGCLGPTGAPKLVVLDHTQKLYDFETNKNIHTRIHLRNS